MRKKIEIRKKRILVLFLFCLIAVYTVYPQAQEIYRVNKNNIKKSSDVKIAWLLPVYVSRVVDGDTIVVEMENPPQGFKEKERVRFIGVDTPETVHPSKPVERYGKEASEFTKATLQGKKVYLAFDWDVKDRYGRVLAYIYLSDGVCFNAVQIQSGYAFAYTKFPFQFLEEFRQYEAEARTKKAGLWM